MRNLTYVIALMLNLTPFVFAENQCPAPIAHVAITVEGIAKLSSAIITQQFNLLKNKVNRISGFKKVLVRPKCDGLDTPTTKCVKFKGLPILDDSGAPTFGGYRPINLDLDLKKTQLDMHLVRAVSCVNFKCSLSIQIDGLIVDGTITNFTYADNGALIAERLKPEFTLIKPALYNLEVSLDPNAETLDQLASMDFTNQVVLLPSGSIQINLRSLNKASNEASQAHGLADMLRQELDRYRLEMKKPGFGESQFARFKNAFLTQRVAEIEKARYPLGRAPDCAELSTEKLRNQCVRDQIKEMRANDQQAVEAFQNYLRAHQLTEKQMILASQQTNIPTQLNDNEVIQFFNSPPRTLDAEEFKQILFETTNRYKALDSGFADLNTGSLLVMADKLIETLMPTLLDDRWNTLIEKDLKPAVAKQINYDFSIASDYWNHVSRVRNLNFQSDERLSRYNAAMNSAEAALKQVDAQSAAGKKLVAQIVALQKQLAELQLYMSTDWLPLNTTVLIDHDRQNFDLLKFQLFEKANACSALRPSEFRDEADAQMYTDFSLDTIRLYFQKMVEQNKLSLCVGSDDPNCKNGSSVIISAPPALSCQNGQIKFDLSYRAKGFGASTDVIGTVGNCDGNPCFRLKSTYSKLNGAVLNFFVGSILNKAVTGALKQVDGLPEPIPNVHLLGVEVNKATCSMRMKWSIQDGAQQSTP